MLMKSKAIALVAESIGRTAARDRKARQTKPLNLKPRYLAALSVNCWALTILYNPIIPNGPESQTPEPTFEREAYWIKRPRKGAT
jgi:hypothetical protein